MKLNADNRNALLAVRAQLVNDDIRKAGNLRKTAHLGSRKPGTGPRIAR